MVANSTRPITLEDLPELLTFEEIIARYCPRKSVREMKRAASRREFEHYKIGHSWLMSPPMIRDFLEHHLRKPRKPAPTRDPRASTLARHKSKTTAARRPRKAA
jgi:hypothetical protein